MATELATAYLTLIPSLRGAQSAIEKQLSGVNTASIGGNLGKGILSGFDASGAMSSVGKTIDSTFGRVAKVGVGAVTGIATAVAALAAKGGLSRAMNMEKAQQMFKGLKLEWKQYKDTINDAVTGTVYGMDEAALVAANLAASGIAAGTAMQKSLNAVVGTAATFGDNLGDIGSMFQKVAAQGKLSGEVVAQFADHGINVTSVLAQALGKTEAEVKQLVKEGKIDFQTFSDAMYATFGDAAQGANETFSGSMANMRNALNRLGEKFADPAMKALTPVFNGVREAVNAVSGRMGPLVEKFTAFADEAGGRAASALGVFTDSVGNGAAPMEALAAAIDSLLGEGRTQQIIGFATAFGIVTALGPALQASAKGMKVVSAGYEVVSRTVDGIRNSFARAADGGVQFAKRLGGSVLSGARAFGGSLGEAILPQSVYTAIDGFPARVGGSLAAARDRAAGAMTGVRETIASHAPGWVTALGDAAGSAVSAFKEKFNIGLKADAEGNLVTRALGRIKSGLGAVGTFSSNALGTLGGFCAKAAGALVPLAGGLLAAGVAAVKSGVDVKAAADQMLANVQVFAENLPEMVQQVVDMLPGLIEQVVAMMPSLVDAVVQTFSTLADAFPVIIPQLVNGLSQMIAQLVPLLVQMAPMLVTAGIQLFTALIQSMTVVIPQIIAVLPQLVSGVCSALIDNMPTLLAAAFKLFMCIVSALVKMLPELIDQLPDLIGQFMDFLIAYGPEMLAAAGKLFMKIADSVPTILNSLLGALGRLLNELPPKIVDFAGRMGTAAKDMVMGMVKGIGDGAKWVIDKIQSMCSDALGAVKSFFGIHSPSRVMRKTFQFVGKGAALGIADEAKAVSDAMRDVARDVEKQASEASPNIRVRYGVDKYDEPAPGSGGAYAPKSGAYDLAEEIHLLRQELPLMIRDNTKHDYEVNGRAVLEIVEDAEKYR